MNVYTDLNVETAAVGFLTTFIFLSLSDSSLEDENEQVEEIAGRTIFQEFKTFFDEKTFGEGEAGEQKVCREFAVSSLRALIACETPAYQLLPKAGGGRRLS